jgi:hypothetical protein
VFVYWFEEMNNSMTPPVMGTWFKATVVNVHTEEGYMDVLYEVDNEESAVYLGMCFLHWGRTPPKHGQAPKMFPSALRRSSSLPTQLFPSNTMSSSGKGREVAVHKAARHSLYRGHISHNYLLYNKYYLPLRMILALV